MQPGQVVACRWHHVAGVGGRDVRWLVSDAAESLLSLVRLG
jgi:hypothetical protein